MFKRLMLTILYLSFLLNLAFGESKCVLEGTWVLYEGGQPAPDVITFMPDGSGKCYELSDELLGSSWVWSGIIDSEFLLNPQEIKWEASDIVYDRFSENDIISMSITIQTENESKRYEALFEYDLSGTGRLGMTLELDNGTGGGWIKIDQVQ